MTTDQIWNDERRLDELNMEDRVPAWIDADITPCNVIAIVQGGCASGAYMPAVTYHTARKIMDEHGDQAEGVLDYLQGYYGDEMPRPEPSESWAGMAVFYLSAAVEVWASAMLQSLEDIEAEAEEALP